jgi:hypothetical protein
MQTDKSFRTFTENASIKAAIRIMTKPLVTIVVEGLSDWHWLQRKINRAAAHIAFATDDAGGKDYVLSTVKELKEKHQRCIGIIDRDLEGFCGKRYEVLVNEIFDTEVRDAEMMMLQTEALLFKMETLVPPTGRHKHIRLPDIYDVHLDALKASTWVGVAELVNAKRREDASPLRPYIDSFPRYDAYDFFNCDAKHRHFEITAFLESIFDRLEWKSHVRKPFHDEVQNEYKQLLASTKDILNKNNTREISQTEINETMPFYIANGHLFMELVTKAWYCRLHDREPNTEQFNKLYQILEKGMYDCFEMLLFKRTCLFEKIQEYCQALIGKSIFILS